MPVGRSASAGYGLRQARWRLRRREFRNSSLRFQSSEVPRLAAAQQASCCGDPVTGTQRSCDAGIFMRSPQRRPALTREAVWRLIAPVPPASLTAFDYAAGKLARGRARRDLPTPAVAGASPASTAMCSVSSTIERRRSMSSSTQNACSRRKT